MAMATTRAPRPAKTDGDPSRAAAAVPMSTGETAATSVAGRAPCHQSARPLLGSPGELSEVWLSPADIGVTTFLRLLAHVVEKGGVARQLLDAGEPVVGGVEPSFD